MFHGLGGSIDSFYTIGMLKAIVKHGWIGVLMHFRGSGDKTNRHAKAYHSGATEDPSEFLPYLKETYPNRPLFAMGFSLGGNVLAKYLGEQGKNSPLDGAVVISAPLRLAPCAKRLDKNFSRIYQQYLLMRLKQGMKQKLQYLKHNFPIKITEKQLMKIKTLREFDNRLTGPLHGFANADDYYEKCSGAQYLDNIATPTLIIHAVDDPFMTKHVPPSEAEISDAVLVELSYTGGHVGFLSGKHPLKPTFWLEQRAPLYIAEQIERWKKQQESK